MSAEQTWWDKIWKDKDGRVVVWQNPNLIGLIAIFSSVFSRGLPYGQANFVAALIAFGSMFTWAWLELFQGVNYFRRALGLVVLAFIITSRV